MFPFSPSLPGPKNNEKNKLLFASKEKRQTALNSANRKNGRKPNLGQTESGTKRQRYHNREKKEKGKKREGKTEKGKMMRKKPQNKGKKEKRKERRKNKKTAKERKGERKEEKKLKRKLKKPLPPKQPKVKKPFRQKRNNRYPLVNRETAKLTICL